MGFDFNIVLIGDNFWTLFCPNIVCDNIWTHFQTVWATSFNFCCETSKLYFSGISIFSPTSPKISSPSHHGLWEIDARNFRPLSFSQGSKSKIILTMKVGIQSSDGKPFICKTWLLSHTLRLILTIFKNIHSK